jgi:hypothetical protein
LKEENIMDRTKKRTGKLSILTYIVDDAERYTLFLYGEPYDTADSYEEAKVKDKKFLEV